MLGNIFTASKDWDIDVVIFLGGVVGSTVLPITLSKVILHVGV